MPSWPRSSGWSSGRLVLASGYRTLGWLLFILSFGAWLAAALLGLREGWARGWFGR